MSIALALSLAVAVEPNCSWNQPGLNPYSGTVSAAIERYRDIPPAVRKELKQRIREGQYDDVVSIERDRISGQAVYEPGIRQMHFGSGLVCNTVSRAKWRPGHKEAALVFCAGDYCILQPKVCGNISRITRRASSAPPVAGARPGQGLPQFASLATNQALPLMAAVSAAAPDELPMLAPRMSNIATPLVQPDPPYLPPAHIGGPSTSPVPEADSWLMLLTGLGLLGWLARRRRPAD